MPDRRVKRTKKNIYTALVDLMLEKSINDITVRELCDKADVNKSTFYLHFMDIYDCRDTWANELLDDIFSRSSTITYEELISNKNQYLNAFFDFFEKDMEFYHKLLNSPMAARAIKLFKDKINENFLEANKSTLAQDYEKAIASTFILGGMTEVFALTIKNNTYNREKINAVFNKFIQSSM